MTEPETTQPVPENDPQSATATAEAPAPEPEVEPPPEPWTPERVSEWNSYYDFYVQLAALLLVFMVSCNFVTDSHVWLHLKAGRLIADQGSPVSTDVFSYTESGKPWINVPWTFQWLHATIYALTQDLVPVNAADPSANRGTAEQIAVGTLVVLNALARLITAWLLLKTRHRGPGLWWQALVVTVAFGVVFQPAYGIMMGGIAGPGSVSPMTWGLLLFAFEMYLLFRAFVLGRSGALWLLIPTFLLWANLDISFLTGLAVLAASAVGHLLDGPDALAGAGPPGKAEGEGDAALASDPGAAKRKPPRAATALVIAAICALVCLVNPSTYHAYETAIYPYTQLFQPAGKITTAELLSFFGPWVREHAGPQWYLLPVFYVIMVAIALASFAVNTRRFLWSRFLPFALISVIWGIFMQVNPFVAIIFAAVVGPNGQEWYLDRFGTEGRLGRLWALWSTGGRLVTLFLIFATVSLDITGWGSTLREAPFGVGYRPDDFPFEAAEFLERHTEIKGNVLNTSMPQGDALIWKAAPERKTYVDGRARFFPPALLEQWEKTRKALSEDDMATWKPLLDQYQISMIMIEVGQSPNTYRALMQSANWIAFYDDGRIVMFGRADAPESDLAFFKANRLDPVLRAFKTSHPVPGAERPPNPTSWIDSVFENRTAGRLQARTESARRWLDVAGAARSPTGDTEALPEPARCFLAIQDARTALARSPDDWVAYRRLNEAYRALMIQEAALLAGIPITPDNARRIRSVAPSLDHLMTRFQQRVTVLNFAIQTTPPPRDLDGRRELAALNLDLFQLYLGANALDLARDRLESVVENSYPDDFPPEARAQFQQQLEQLNQQKLQLANKLEDLEIERQASPVEQASFALSQGGAGRAIIELANAESSNISPAVVKPRLIDLYCNTGQPEKALELLGVGAIDDPNLGTEPGSAALRQGRVYFLLGNYLSAASLWRDRAIPRVRADRSGRFVAAGVALARGEAMQATNTFLALPATLTQQASWEYDLAMCYLEAGTPEDAAEHFTQALKLAPDLAVRPIAAYYLEKMGRPVPPPSKSTGATAKPAGSQSNAPSTGGILDRATISPPALPPVSTEAAKPASAQPPTTKDAPESAAPKIGPVEKPAPK
jgi:tetratricopeptide (TPR) repeat protein